MLLWAIQFIVTFTLLSLEEKNLDVFGIAQLKRIGFQRSTESLKKNPITLSGQIDATQILFLDTSRMINTNFEGDPPRNYTHRIGYTDRLELSRTIIRLVQDGVKVVGVDIDFSPDESAKGGEPPENHHNFIFLCNLLSFSDDERRLFTIETLKKLREGKEPNNQSDPAKMNLFLQAKHLAKSEIGELLLAEETLAAVERGRTTIVLGVGRSFFTSEHDNWLGYGGEIKRMAGSVTLLSHDNINPPIYSIIPKILKRKSGKEASLPSLSFQVAKAAVGKEKEGLIGKFQSNGLTNIKTIHLNDTIEIEGYYPNYALKSLIHKETSKVDIEDYLNGAKLPSSKTNNTIVFIGDADEELTSDKIIVPGERVLLPGIYAHAIGTYTLLNDPVLRMTRPLEYSLNFLVATAAFFFVRLKSFPFLLERNSIRENIAEFNCTVLAVLFLAWFLAYVFRILWIGSLACILGSGIELLLGLYLFTGTKKRTDSIPEGRENNATPTNTPS
ncbi:hypothetical protein VDG1235_1462 [Verrucomicrobiia bacterium DG1235]|nr:hypothetical protein VDG1235_1462 [Verrucomicrobiae bacterium DG1235]